MATELSPNVCTALTLSSTVVLEVAIRSTWFVVWSAEGEDVYLVTHGVADGGALPTTRRTIPAALMPFPIEVSPYGGRLFLAASSACTATFEARENA